VVARGHLEGGARVPLPASRCARASFRLRQVDEVQAETSARMFRDGTYGPALCLCPAPKLTPPLIMGTHIGMGEGSGMYLEDYPGGVGSTTLVTTQRCLPIFRSRMNPSFT
jgi:hypothetical protein